jgi:hypothetical protein
MGIYLLIQDLSELQFPFSGLLKYKNYDSRKNNERIGKASSGRS